MKDYKTLDEMCADQEYIKSLVVKSMLQTGRNITQTSRYMNLHYITLQSWLKNRKGMRSSTLLLVIKYLHDLNL